MTAVVLCGSLGATAAMWDAQSSVLDGHDVVHVEHPGHGGAPVLEGFGIDTLAERLLDAAPARFTLVGLSLGAAVAAEAAARSPERVERLVLCCLSRRFGDPGQWNERAALVRAEGVKAVVDAALGRWFTPAFSDTARFRAMYLSVDPEGYARCCEALAGWDGSAALARIAAPTLAVAGSEDPTSPVGEVEAVAALVPNARLLVLEPAGHLATVERADIFNHHLEELL